MDASDGGKQHVDGHNSVDGRTTGSRHSERENQSVNLHARRTARSRGRKQPTVDVGGRASPPLSAGGSSSSLTSGAEVPRAGDLAKANTEEAKNQTAKLREHLKRVCKALNTLSEDDVKIFQNIDRPTITVRKVMEAVAITLGLEPVKSAKGRKFMVVSRRAAQVRFLWLWALACVVTCACLCLSGDSGHDPGG